MDFKLTKEEQKISEDNINLMYAAMNKYGISDEYSGLASIAYCTAVYYWSKRKNKNLKLSTYVYRVILHQYIKAIKKEDAVKRKGYYSISAIEYLIEDNGAAIELETASSDIKVNDLFNLLTEKEKQAALLRSKKKCLREIGRDMRCSHESVRMLLKSAEKKMQKYLYCS